MPLKARKKLLILTLNLLALIILLLIQENRIDRIIQREWGSTEHPEILLTVTLMAHNQAIFNWIAGICLTLLVLNMILYRQWVNSRKWVLEPILILVISYGLAFTFYTYRTFAHKDQLIEEKKLNHEKATDPDFCNSLNFNCRNYSNLTCLPENGRTTTYRPTF